MNKYKVLVPKAIGAGTFGEKFPDSIISIKNESHTQSFVSIGNLDTQTEAENLQKYIKTEYSIMAEPVIPDSRATLIPVARAIYSIV